MSRNLINFKFRLASREVWLILGRRKPELHSPDNCKCTPLKREAYHRAFSTFKGDTCTRTPSTCISLGSKNPLEVLISSHAAVTVTLCSTPGRNIALETFLELIFDHRLLALQQGWRGWGVIWGSLINPWTPELNPSAQRCLTRFFTGDFPSWTVHFVNICVKNQQMQQLFIQFINYVW
jgi:hypothetical protein